VTASAKDLPAPPPDPTADSRARVTLIAVVAFYVGALALLAYLGFYAMVFKTLVVPTLFLAALLSRQLGGFVRDWALFLGQLALFDALRGYIFALVGAFELPLYMGYVIRWEEALFGGTTLPGWLQQTWYRPGHVGLLDRLLVVVHGSHFVFFLLFGLVVWFLRREEFWRYTTALPFLMYLGLLGYLAVPTVPPWMAATAFHVIPPISRIAAHIYNIAVPTLRQAFDTNSIAAMPSLHAAFPTLCCLIGLRHFGWQAWLLPPYVLLVFVALAYLGEHYFLDIVAGVGLAFLVYALVYRADWPHRLARWSRKAPASSRLLGGPLIRPLVLAGVLLLLSEAVGQVTTRVRTPLLPNRAFVERELVGKSDVASLYRGLLAYRARDYATAQGWFARAVTEVQSPGTRARAQELLGRSAFAQEDYGTAAHALSQVPVLDDQGTLMLALSHLHRGQRQDGLALLRRLQARAPADPVLTYWAARYGYLSGELTADQVRQVIGELRGRPDQRAAAALARDLEGLLDGQSPRTP
jgi:hypothetical protein